MTEQPSHHARFRVSMRDIDIFGHVHNSVYLDYCEDAIAEYLRAIGIFSQFRHHTSGVAYHVKKAEVTFHGPLSVDDIVGADVTVERIGNTSLTFQISLFRESDHTHCATGRLVWVCVGLEDGKPMSVPEQTRTDLAPGTNR